MDDAPVEPNAVPDFRCRVCGCDRYFAIQVKRASGKWYRTPFYKCCGCSVVFEDPLDFSGLRELSPGYREFRANANNVPGSKPMIPPAPNPFAAGRRRR